MTESALPTPARAAAPRRNVGQRRFGRAEIVTIVVIGALLIGAIGAGLATLYRLYWGPEAFVERYVELLSEGRAADALAVPGVALDSADLEAAGSSTQASDALLRNAALPGEISNVAVVGSRMVDGVAEVTLSYSVQGANATSTFRVEQDGWSGLVPSWQFQTSPLAVLDVSVSGSMRFTVNQFELDKRQVSPDGMNADPAASVGFLVFTPSAYSVSVDTAAAVAEPEQVVADEPLSEESVSVQAQPSDEFTQIVTTEVHNFLDACTTQKVLQPTGCPFGFMLSDRLASEPTWTIKTQPKIAIVPDGATWKIAQAAGIAQLDMKVQSIYDGSVTDVSENVTFTIDGTIDIQPDGSAAISVGSPDLNN